MDPPQPPQRRKGRSEPLGGSFTANGKEYTADDRLTLVTDQNGLAEQHIALHKALHKAKLRRNSTMTKATRDTIGVIRLPIVTNRKRYRDEIASALKVVAVRVAHHTILRDL